MNEQEYREGIKGAFELAALLMELELDPLIKAAERADTIGPYVDPTLWMRGNKALEQQLVILHALRAAQGRIGPARLALSDMMVKQLAKRAEEAEAEG
jgi:hypothetical protein